MANKKTSKPQRLRNFLSFILATLIIGGGVLFYFGLQIIQDYSLEVNTTLKLADTNDEKKNLQQALRSQTQQNQSINATLDAFFANPNTIETQVKKDVSAYASKVGISGVTALFEANDTEPTIATLTFANPVEYTKFIQFLTLIEGNLPKMHVTSLDIQPSENTSGSSIIVNELKVGVTVR